MRVYMHLCLTCVLYMCLVFDLCALSVSYIGRVSLRVSYI